MAMKLDPYGLDRGIDRVTYHVPEGGTLHDVVRLPPSEAGGGAELDRLLALPNLHDYAAAALRPEIADKAMLTPHGFLQALTGADQLLRRHRANNAIAPKTAQLLDQALAILADEATLRELLRAYRSALQQA